MHSFNKIPNKYLVNTLLKLKRTFGFHCLELLHKKSVKMRPKNNAR